MSKIHVYIKPFLDDTGSSYASSWTDVSKDVTTLGDLSQQLDNTEYDVGIFRASNMKLSLRNDHGRYNDAGDTESLFKYKRSESLVKVTWEPGDGPLVCGFFFCGACDALLSEEITLFEGMLDDTATQSQIDDIDIDFQILGYEQLLSKIQVPYASISNGDSVATILLALINQSPFNARVTVSGGNISVGQTWTIDDKTKIQNKTVLEALKLVLLPSNAVFYIEDNVAYVAPRTASATLSKTFYGAAATSGIEEVVDVKAYRNGVHRILNYLTWKDSSLTSTDSTSVAKYGTKKKEISFDGITDGTDKQNILDAIKSEFASVKREMQLEAFFSPENLPLFLLDRIAIDYPTLAIPNENEPVAYYGYGEYGIHYYPTSLFNLTIESTARFKIMSRRLDFKNETVTYGVREI